MGDAIGGTLGLAVGVAISPVPIIAIILMLATPRGRANGTLFAIGWLAGLVALGTVVLLLAAVRQWRSRPAPGEEAPMPKWMAGIDRLQPLQASGLGALLAAINPKNGALTIAAASVIAGTGNPGWPAGRRARGLRDPRLARRARPARGVPLRR
jgi:threonine/homoserine/homoserine lactone efflux protein